MELIGTFGFHTSTELDKSSLPASARDAAGMPYVAEQVCATFSAKVVTELDLGTHVLFIGEVDEAYKVEGAAAAMTYAFYHQVRAVKPRRRLPATSAKRRPPGCCDSGAGAARRLPGAAPIKPTWNTSMSCPTISCALSAASARNSSSAWNCNIAG